MGKPRVHRDLPEMLGQLERQLALLEEYSKKAFEEGREDFLPEVAGKLRILLVRSRYNKPLLFEVADRLNVPLTSRLGGPPVRPPPGEPGPGDEIALDLFFDLHAVSIRTSAGLVSMTKRELIRAWCEQLGGAHEDWQVDEALINAVRFPIQIAGIQPSAMELRNSARTALRYGRHVLNLAKGNPV